jgi:2'-5' RNA ligase
VVENQYFNLALIPESDDLRSVCVELARANCGERADSYLLGDVAMPHVTLCQFNASPTNLREIWGAFDDLHTASISLAFRHIYVQYGKGELAGMLWVGLAVKYEPALIELQKTIYARLAKLGIEGRNVPANYFPHLTFARCDASAPVIISAAPLEDFWGAPFQFRMTIGSSDEHGRYHETLCGAVRG